MGINVNINEIAKAVLYTSSALAMSTITMWLSFYGEFKQLKGELITAFQYDRRAMCRMSNRISILGGATHVAPCEEPKLDKDVNFLTEKLK
jgi:hypothetical protein